MNSGLNGLPSHFSKPTNLVGSTLALGQVLAPNIFTTGNGTNVAKVSTNTADALYNNQPAINISQTWNNPAPATSFVGIYQNINVIASGFTGVQMLLQKNGGGVFSISEDGVVNTGGKILAGSFTNPSVSLGDGNGYAVNASNNYTIGWSSSNNPQSAPDTLFTRAAAATLQQGAADAAACVAQTTRVQSIVAGTTDVAGADWTRRASLSTGTAAGGNLIEQTGFSAKSTGTSQGTAVDRKILVAKGKVLTSGAAFSMFDVALPTLSMCGGVIEATIICTDGADMQSFTQTVTYSAVNKGGVYTTSITPSTGDKSVSAGTLTTSWTVVSGTNKVTIKVTPTTSLTPSANSFLLYYTIKNNSEQATTIL